MTDRTGSETPGVAGWITLLCGGALCAGVSVAIVWLLWSYVPVHAALFEGLGLPLPLSTRISIAASNWFVRMLPFGVVGSFFVVPLGLAGATILMIALEPWWRAARVFLAVGLVMATLGSAGGGFVVFSIHAAYREATTNPRVQENLRACQEARERQHEGQVEQ